MTNLISGDSTFTSSNTSYVAYEGGLRMSFVGSVNDSLHAAGGHGTSVYGTHTQGLQIDLTGTNGLASGNQTSGVGTGTNIHLSMPQGMTTITDFSKSDTLNAVQLGFKSGADAYAHLQSYGAQGGSILYNPIGGTEVFVHSTLSAASFGA